MGSKNLFYAAIVVIMVGGFLYGATSGLSKQADASVDDQAQIQVAQANDGQKPAPITSPREFNGVTSGLDYSYVILLDNDAELSDELLGEVNRARDMLTSSGEDVGIFTMHRNNRLFDGAADRLEISDYPAVYLICRNGGEFEVEGGLTFSNMLRTYLNLADCCASTQDSGGASGGGCCAVPGETSQQAQPKSSGSSCCS
jgi:hypothetical protein